MSCGYQIWSEKSMIKGSVLLRAKVMQKLSRLWFHWRRNSIWNQLCSRPRQVKLCLGLRSLTLLLDSSGVQTTRKIKIRGKYDDIEDIYKLQENEEGLRKCPPGTGLAKALLVAHHY